MCPVCKKANIRGQHTHSHAIRKFVVCTLMQAKNRIEAGHILGDYARYTLHRGRGKMVGPSFRGYHIWNVLGCRGTGCGRWHEHPLAHGDRSSSVSNITGSPPSGSCPFFTFFFLCPVFGLGLLHHFSLAFCVSVNQEVRMKVYFSVNIYLDRKQLPDHRTGIRFQPFNEWTYFLLFGQRSKFFFHPHQQFPSGYVLQK